jgi:hypothetical protein
VPLEHKLSHAFSVSHRLDAAGNDVIILEYKYLTFELVLDDEKKRGVLEFIVTGKMRAKEKPQSPPVKLPTFYRGKP